ncbi:MAG: M20/M25/M40 family metallo-hydrolase [Candidatus Cryptobacteroides sp.]
MKKEWKFNAEAYGRFTELMTVISPSMEEKSMAKFLGRKCRAANMEIATDVMGNLHAIVNPQASIHIGLVAHMDTVAIQITKICDNGLLQFRSIGLRPHTLLGQPMKVVTDKGLVDGVIGFDPTSQYGQPKGLVEDDLWLDIGASNHAEACSKVSVGDLAVFTPRCIAFGEHCISGSGIDDRIGLFAATECLDMLGDNCPNVCIHLIGTTQEEVGLRGAAIIAAQQELDACFIIDVDYATDTFTPHENQMGALHLGKGVGLHIKSDNIPVLRSIAENVAERNGIPIQKSVGRFIYGGTDATAIQLQCKGIATLNVNIPCRYMHSPVELCDKRDVECAIELLAGCIEHISSTKQKSFVPTLD